MANLISNLQGCLDFFTLPDIQYEEHDGYFVRSAITTDIVRMVNSGELDRSKGRMEVKALDSKFSTCNEDDWKKLLIMIGLMKRNMYLNNMIVIISPLILKQELRESLV